MTVVATTSNMTYPTKDVVNAILQRSFREGRRDVSPMKVQKLLFYLDGWYLAVTGEPAIDDAFEVWKFGPVVPTVYHELKSYGSGPVTSYLKRLDLTTKTYQAYVVADTESKFQEVLDLTWEKYVGIDPLRLSAMTHAPDSPWAKAKRRGDTIIDNETIKTYFVGLAQSASANRRDAAIAVDNG